MFARLLSLIIWVACLSFPSQALSALFEQQTPAFVTVNQAFGFDFNQQGHQLTLSWTLKPGYYLYRHKITISSQHASLASWQLPPGKPHKDEFFGQTEIYPHNLSLPLTLRQAGPDAMLTVTYQGCAAAGFCYPPETRTVPLSATEPASPAPSVEALPLPFSPLWALLIGIGVAFTPCVLPMYPMISGIILGGRRTLSSGRILSLAFLYIQGMAVTYTLMGMVVAAAGLRFQAALQSPVLLILLAVIFILLALPMFGLFNLQLPSSVQTRLTLWSNQQQGGSLAGVFVMGILAGLICSPCTTAPLSAILLYIAQSGNLLAGAATLYIYAIGMGLPLIAVTLFGSQLLPRSGPWMQTVKEGFGFVILTLPVFFIERIIGDTWGLRLWSLLGVAAAGWAFLLAGRSASGWGRWLALLWLVLAMLAARPLQDWAFPATRPQTTPAVLSFVPVHTAEQLREKLQQTTHKITLVDLYADWCVACKEFEKYTFTDPQVKAGLAGMQRLQADVTANSAADHQLLSDLKVLGLPTLLFFDPHGHEIPGSRISGYLNPRQFIAHVQRVRQSQPD